MDSRLAGPSPLVSFRDVAIRTGERLLFAGSNWDILPGEHWAIVGPNGSGKSLLVSALAGQIPIVQGTLEHRLSEGVLEAHDLGATHARRNQVVLVSLADQRGLLSRHAGYHQARWNASDAENGPTVEFLLTRQSVEAINPFEVLPEQTDAEAFESRRARAVALFGLSSLLRRRVKQLSNGEMRKLILARALVRGPRLLVLDDPMGGLDQAFRAELAAIVDEVALGGTTIVLATAREDEIPACITHILRVDNFCVVGATPRKRGLSAFKKNPAATRPPRSAETWKKNDGAPLIEMKAVTVRYGEAAILDRVDFTLRRGEHVALLGPNGAGKSTLLSLILADNPQAYANHVRLFGQQRGTGESIWDIKARIGWVAPELLLHYPPDWRCLDVVCSGYFASVGLFHECGAEEATRAKALLAKLGLESQGGRTLADLSHGNQRLVLLGRALVANPELLILDEPCQGLDASHTRLVNDAVDRTSRDSRASIIYVTHHEDEIPACVTRIIRLNAGRVVD